MTPLQRSRAQRKQRTHAGGPCDRMWQAARIMRQFSTADLVAACELSRPDAAGTYLSALRRAGYLRTRQRRGQRLPALHTLIRDTGPKRPALVRKNSVVWDPNTDTEYPIR